MNIELRQIRMPGFSFPDERPAIPREEYERRLQALYAAAGTDWVVVYADREHYANLVYLVNYDPRFEESLLVLGPGGRRYLLVGNEGQGYARIVPIDVEVLLSQTLSLNGQPRNSAPRISDVLRRAGIAPGQRIGVVGWKYLESFETDDPQAPAFVPAFIVNVLRELVGPQGAVIDVTRVMMDGGYGLRAVNSADQIAAFEWAARSASAAVFTVLRGARPGMSETEAMGLMDYSGTPFSMHPILVSGKGELNGLCSPGARRLEEGDAISIAVGYWGSLCCRAGRFARPDPSFFDRVSAPYYRAIATWYQTMQLGVTGGEVFQKVAQAFEGSPYSSALNPGHLISLEEWLDSPIRPDSQVKIVSGMVFQSDIIPAPMAPGDVINCEDTIAVADAALRAAIQAHYPEMWSRIQARRDLARELGLSLIEELLPLSDGAGYLPPFWMVPDLVCKVT